MEFIVLPTTPGRPNSVVSKCTLQNSSQSYAFVQVSPQNQPLHNHQTKHTYTHFRRVSPFSITPDKRAHKTKTRWYRRPFRLIYDMRLKGGKECTEIIIFKKDKSYSNASWQIAVHMAASCTCHQPSSPYRSTRA